jgi:hypothetical protein
MRALRPYLRRSCPGACEERLRVGLDLTDTVRRPDQMGSLCKQSKQPTLLKPDTVAAPNIADGQ